MIRPQAGPGDAWPEIYPTTQIKAFKSHTEKQLQHQEPESKPKHSNTQVILFFYLLPLRLWQRQREMEEREWMCESQRGRVLRGIIWWAARPRYKWEQRNLKARHNQ